MEATLKTLWMKFSVLGCGWLGLPLAEFLVKKEFVVKGSTTSEEKLLLLKSKRIHPYLIEINNQRSNDAIEDFLQTDVLFVNVPFGKQRENRQAYVDLIAKIEQSSVQKVIFVSSTSVYADTNSTITKTAGFEINPAKQGLLDLENLFRGNKHFDCTVIRFSGLIGGSRNPGNFFKEGRIVKNGLAPVNLIHLKDCIHIVYTILEKKAWNQVFNASADSHPTRKEFYTAATLLANKTPATFLEELDRFKIISNEPLKKALGYTFHYPDLMQLL